MRGDSTRFDSLVAAARKGDQDAIGALFVDLNPRLLRFLRARSAEDVDDLAGDVWLAVAKSLDGFVGDWDDFRKWFFAIARRRVADSHRTRYRRRALVEAGPLDGPSAETVNGCDETALDHLQGQQAATLLASMLTADQADVVLLRVVGDLDTDQVAAIMHRSPGWVRVTQHRALRRLADRVGDWTVVAP